MSGDERETWSEEVPSEKCDQDAGLAPVLEIECSLEVTFKDDPVSSTV